MAKNTLAKLKRFSKLSPQTKLYLTKALIIPHLEYPPIPLNTIKKSNQIRLQATLNSAVRWVEGITPPYHTKIKDLHQQWRLDPLNTRNFQQSLKVWDKLRINCPDIMEELTEEREGRAHYWWPSALIQETDEEPQPLYTRTINEPAEDDLPDSDSGED